MHFIVYRNYLGQTHFSSLVLKKVAKIKDVNEKSKIRSKFSVGVKDSGKYKLEYV
jgi:hypothetical protein